MNESKIANTSCKNFPSLPGKFNRGEIANCDKNTIPTSLADFCKPVKRASSVIRKFPMAYKIFPFGVSSANSVIKIVRKTEGRIFTLPCFFISVITKKIAAQIHIAITLDAGVKSIPIL